MTHLPVSNTAISGGPVLIADLHSWGKLDLTNPAEGRQHSADGTSSNNYQEGAVVQDSVAPTRYLIVFRHSSVANTQYWEFASATARDTALANDVTTPLTTTPSPDPLT